jgi:hypothetical protein
MGMCGQRTRSWAGWLVSALLVAGCASTEVSPSPLAPVSGMPVNVGPLTPTAGSFVAPLPMAASVGAQSAAVVQTGFQTNAAPQVQIRP